MISKSCFASSNEHKTTGHPVLVEYDDYDYHFHDDDDDDDDDEEEEEEQEEDSGVEGC